MTTSAPAPPAGRVDQVAALPSPRALAAQLPLTSGLAATVDRARREVTDVLDGRDPRLLVVVGPCSVHDPVAATEYAVRLRAEADRLGEDLLVVMRVYFEKPRTSLGWRGLINDPGLDGSGDVVTGLRLARALLLDITALGVPSAVEFLDPLSAKYIEDLVTWGAIGARTVESQPHRQLASGLAMPIGMKNRPDGRISPAVDALLAAAASHVFPGVDADGAPALLRTAGNPDCHVVLRGGDGRPNHSAADVAGALALLRAAGLPERVVVDCSHGNSRKDHRRQPIVADDVCEQLTDGQHGLRGVLLESFLVPGRQDVVPGRTLAYGQSITDSCLGWEDTVAVLERLATAAAKRRG
ncbi:3-deoxy-7-phosphoheptulonate synthase [Crossiella equi]|uniref:Phospho-2-dehydro-3-deoxyheptonate aldolase n=1 Tax=Crossiella equi TaxID=130796 RepID=A0ABS5A819_9PSEU|nr:3-deoxy-7-phosphoheptulonate synthase [Crossiella equi]MBP2472374.1 3-deoxy-7-phosphoheptulonate synthase [Crossiella equi]